MTSPLNAAEHHGNGEHIRHEQRDQSRTYQDSDQHHPRMTPRAATHPSDGQLRAFASAFSFSRVGTRTSAHSERPALSSVCAGRFVSGAA